jgi:hypothetical protein
MCGTDAVVASGDASRPSASTACASDGADRARRPARRPRDLHPRGSRDRIPGTGTPSTPGTAERDGLRRRCSSWSWQQCSDGSGRPQDEEGDDQEAYDDDPGIAAMRDMGAKRVVTHAVTVPAAARPTRPGARQIAGSTCGPGTTGSPTAPGEPRPDRARAPGAATRCATPMPPHTSSTRAGPSRPSTSRPRSAMRRRDTA